MAKAVIRMLDKVLAGRSAWWFRVRHRAIHEKLSNARHQRASRAAAKGWQTRRQKRAAGDLHPGPTPAGRGER